MFEFVLFKFHAQQVIMRIHVDFAYACYGIIDLLHQAWKFAEFYRGWSYKYYFLLKVVHVSLILRKLKNFKLSNNLFKKNFSFPAWCKFVSIFFIIVKEALHRILQSSETFALQISINATSCCLRNDFKFDVSEKCQLYRQRIQRSEADVLTKQVSYNYRA